MPGRVPGIKYLTSCEVFKLAATSGQGVRMAHCKPLVKKAVGLFDSLNRPCLIGKGGTFGAGDEARTRYLHLGKVALYRMSYARTEQSLL